jgi:uncharacterized spore protein YtfJ
MRIDELTTAARDALSAKRVYAEPVERDGVTVIGVAAVGGAGGGGQGEDDKGQHGVGGGFGLTARPVGAYVLKGGNVGWMPAVDVNRLLTSLATVLVVYLLTRSRMARARLKAESKAESLKALRS